MPETPTSAPHPVILAHFESLQRTRENSVSSSASCKYWSVALASALLAFALERQAPNIVLLALAPVALLAFLDAGQVAKARHQKFLANNLVEQLKKAPGKPDLEWVKTSDPEDTKLGIRAALAWMRALASLTVWPFYFALMGSTVILGTRLSKGDSRTPGSIRPSPSAFNQPLPPRGIAGNQSTLQPGPRPVAGQTGTIPQGPGLRPQPAVRPAQGPTATPRSQITPYPLPSPQPTGSSPTPSPAPSPAAPVKEASSTPVEAPR